MSPAQAQDYARAVHESLNTEGHSHERLPIVLDLRYKFLRNQVEQRGAGRTLNISSAGLLFEAVENFDGTDALHGTAIELALN